MNALKIHSTNENKTQKSKRMKTVFSSNGQLCHIFAQQTHENGKGNNLFFERTTDIYSYGYHYLAARVYNTKKGRVVLVNNHSYSSSTAKHLSNIRSAFAGLESVKMFCVPSPGQLNSSVNVEHFNNEVYEAVDRVLRATKIERDSTIKFLIGTVETSVKEANEFFSLIGEKQFSVPSKFYDLLKEHLQVRHKRTLELNQGSEVRKLKAEKNLKLKGPERLKTLKELWVKNGDRKTYTNIEKLEKALELPSFDLVRVSGERVITSRSASVSLKAALKIIRKLQNDNLEEGEQVDNFSVVRVNKENGTVKIGCHLFSISEALEVLSPYLENGLKLVEEVNPTKC